MSKKKITISEALNHGDDIDVDSALQNLSSQQILTKDALQNIYRYSHALKNHLNVKPFLQKAGLNPNQQVNLTDLIRAEIK